MLKILISFALIFLFIYIFVFRKLALEDGISKFYLRSEKLLDFLQPPDLCLCGDCSRLNGYFFRFRNDFSKSLLTLFQLRDPTFPDFAAVIPLHETGEWKMDSLE